MISGRLKIDLSYLGNNNILIYPIFSDEGEKILDARVVLTEDKKNEIIEKHGKIVYYTFSGEMENIPNHIINNAINKSKDIMSEIIKTDRISKVSYNDAENLIKSLLNELYKADTQTIKLMKALNTFDDYTYNHSVNVMILTAVFASKLKIFKPEEMKSLLLGAFLHDVGKMKIDKQILNKSGSLTTNEFQVMKRHP
ncbi:MAG: HD domain-containing protein, partial [Spirochaetes bacterium]|nr:HD domain-containing protein [Spirochaetota bacterium]